MSPSAPTPLHILQRISRTLSHHSRHPSAQHILSATTDAQSLTSLLPTLPAAWLALFSAHTAAGDTTLAVRVLDEALEHCPHDQALVYLKVAVENRLDGDTKHILLVAEASLAAGAFQDAIKNYTKIVQLGNCCKEYVHALRGRSDAWLRKGRQAQGDYACFERAAADAGELVRLCPRWEEGWLWLGIAHLENGYPARARDVFKTGLRLCSGSMKLVEWLRDAELVIEIEGAESELEDQRSENIDGTTEEKAITGDIQMPRTGRRAMSCIEESIADGNFGEAISSASRANFVRKVSGLGMARERLRERLAGGSWDHGRGDPCRPAEVRDLNVVKRQRQKGLGECSGTEWECHRNGGVGKELKDSNFYELLGISRDASTDRIKGAYYRLARMYHPDKNHDDEKAKVKFQQLSEAYRILSDPESRNVYDKSGGAYCTHIGQSMIDPTMLFAMVFGSDKFMHLVGQFRLATVASHVDENGNITSSEVLDGIQKDRVEKLVVEMLKTLKPWVDGDKQGFLVNVNKEMNRLRRTRFGPSLLHTVGSAYLQYTMFVLDRTRPMKQLSTMMRKATQRSHRIASQQRAMSAAGRVVDKQRRMHGDVMKREFPSMPLEEALAKEQEMAERAVDMMWKISVLDIESTLEEVLDIVLSGQDLEYPHLQDKDFSWGVMRNQKGRTPKWSGVKRLAAMQQGHAATTKQEVLSERAYAILEMGKVFRSALK